MVLTFKPLKTVSSGEMGQSGAGKELHPWLPLPGTRGAAVGSPWTRGQTLRGMGSPGGSGRGPRGPGDGGSEGMGSPGGSGWRLTGDRGRGQQTGSLGTRGRRLKGSRTAGVGKNGASNARREEPLT